MSENFYDTSIGYEPEIDFENTNVVIENGSPKLINELEAIRQWIILFVNTEKDTMKVYEGTGFGCRIKKLFGSKKIGYGFEESELERDFTEGLPLCPAILSVPYFNVSKEAKKLIIKLQAELYNSELIDVSIEKTFKIKGI